MTGEAPELSIIIPAYNEEARLPRTLTRIQEYLGGQDFSAEIIVVDDGSTDGTAGVTEDWRGRQPSPEQLRLLRNEGNRGKGFSVRRGMLAARGRLTLFTDADLSAPIDETKKLLDALADADVAIGSRAINRALIEVHQSGMRERAGMIFNFIVRMITGLPFADTQCGFKAFRRERCKEVFEQQRVEGFGFDPEVLFLAQRQGLRIAEIPVRWSHDPATKVHVVRDSLRMLADLFVIRWNQVAGRYPIRVTGGR
jgi:glycosyltransferase involved in cell wall biosynthesis